jgi:hypothetical protein
MTRTKSGRAYRYTDEQVSDMLRNASLWTRSLRDAADERGAGFSSVTPIQEVLAFLWNRLEHSK